MSALLLFLALSRPPQFACPPIPSGWPTLRGVPVPGAILDTRGRIVFQVLWPLQVKDWNRPVDAWPTWRVEGARRACRWAP